MTLRLENASTQRHDLQLVRAVAGHTLEELLRHVGSENAPLEPWTRSGGGIGTVGPGGSADVTLDLQLGTYWYFSTERIGGDAGPLQAVHGMAGEVTVEGTSGATLPRAPASLVLGEHSIVPERLGPGLNQVRLSNDGAMPHDALFLPVAPGATFEQATQALASDKPAALPPPIDFDSVVSVAAFDPGPRAVVSLDLRPGTYAVVCLLPDPGTTEPSHLRKGMATELRVG